MYLAPLNFDYFFKKVFSNTSIAKQFIEDLLSVEIQSIEVVNISHKLTDNATKVEFDYRCKIDDEFVIIEMQQAYKQNVIKRFYTYHAANTALQLELEQGDKESSAKDKTHKFFDYNDIQAVKTIIWMVQDTLGFSEDIVSYGMLPYDVLSFIQDDKIWKNGNLEELQKRRKFLLNLSENDTKKLTFLRKNQLLFAFQRNIVKNKKLEKYVRWFRFAQKTRSKENEALEFEEFKNDIIFDEIIRLLKKGTMEQDNLTLDVEKLKLFYRDAWFEEFEEETIEKIEKEAVAKLEKAKREAEQKIKNIVKNMLNANLAVDMISNFTNLSVETVEEYIKEIKGEKKQDIENNL